MSCTFCTSSEVRARTIVREELTWAFPSNTPIVPGHTLVCPARCVATLRELTDQEQHALWQLVERIKLALERCFGAEGFNIAINEGVVAGQTVPHLHVHVVPRKEGDKGIHEYEPRKFLYRPGSRAESTEKELQEFAGTLRDTF